MIKSLPVLILALVSIRRASSYRGSDAAFSRAIGCGLALSSVGDILLDLQEQDKRLFLLGLVAFLVRAFVYRTISSTRLTFHATDLCSLVIFVTFMHSPDMAQCTLVQLQSPL